MADDTLDPTSGNSPADPSGGSGSSVISDPRFARLAELEDYAARAQATFERLAPLEDDIKALEDEGYRDFQRTSRKSYYQMVEEQKRAEAESLSPTERRLLDEIDKRLKPAIEEVDVLRKDRESRNAREAATAKEATERFTRENLQYAERLVAEQKLTSDEVQELARYAKVMHDESVAKGEPRFVPLEEAYKRIYGRAEAKAGASRPVPRSQRATSGAPGVPGASKAPTERIDASRPGNFTTEMLKRINQRKTG